MTSFFNGLATAIITPFDEKGINLEEFGKMLDFQTDGGADAVVVLGTTGEPATMTEREKEEVMRFAVKKAKGKIKLIFGTGSNCTAHAVEASKKAEDLGADGLLVVTPYYNKCTQNGLYDYYESVCGAVKLPVICYNVPPRTGVNILPATMERLAHIPNMAGVKEACGNMEQICETMRRIRGKCDLYSGDDNLNLPILAIGGTALISVVSNLAPKGVKEMYIAFAQGDLKKANELQDKLLPLIDACFLEVNPIPAKAGLNMLGFDAGLPRAPLTDLEEAHKAIMREAMKTYGLKVVK